MLAIHFDDFLERDLDLRGLASAIDGTHDDLVQVAVLQQHVREDQYLQQRLADLFFFDQFQ